jgi:oxaloacetate decarboxylase alpha subunit
LAYALRQLGFEVGLDGDKVKRVNDYFVPIRDSYLKSGLLDPLVMATDADALNYQIPGGMISNLISQLKAQDSMDRFGDVLLETPRVREDLGYPPLVTPTSQIVGVQAVANVLAGERYKNVSKEVKAYLRGEYGRAPGEVNKELQKRIVGDEIIEGRYADGLEPEFDRVKLELGSKARSDEDVLSYILFPQVAEKFFQVREAEEQKRTKYTIEAI